MPEPEDPEDVSAVVGVASLLWELDRRNRADSHVAYSEARAAGTTARYDAFALGLWQRGWLDVVAIVSDVGGPNSL